MSTSASASSNYCRRESKAMGLSITEEDLVDCSWIKHTGSKPFPVLNPETGRWAYDANKHEEWANELTVKFFVNGKVVFTEQGESIEAKWKINTRESWELNSGNYELLIERDETSVYKLIAGGTLLTKIGTLEGYATGNETLIPSASFTKPEDFPPHGYSWPRPTFEKSRYDNDEGDCSWVIEDFLTKLEQE